MHQHSGFFVTYTRVLFLVRKCSIKVRKAYV